MYDAPSDRDYAELLNPSEPEPEDPENIPVLETISVRPVVPQVPEWSNDDCPF